MEIVSFLLICAFFTYLIQRNRKPKVMQSQLRYGEQRLQEHGGFSSEGALFRAWLGKRIQDIGYDPKDPPQHLKKALETGNPKDLPMLIYGEWSSFKRASNNTNVQVGYEHGHPGETSEGRNARIQRNIDANNKWVRENAWKYKNSAPPTDQIHIGPRGGRYRWNRNGRKSYDV